MHTYAFHMTSTTLILLKLIQGSPYQLPVIVPVLTVPLQVSVPAQATRASIQSQPDEALSINETAHIADSKSTTIVIYRLFYQEKRMRK